MEIRAYCEEYLECAQRVAGDMMDFAIVTLGISPELFEAAFVSSKISEQMAEGNPAYVAGRNGCEIARQILDGCRVEYTDAEDAMYLDKSPEYWAGWALALFQWHCGRSYKDILQIVPLTEIIGMYGPYHEMDPERFVEDMYDIIRHRSQMTRLAWYRTVIGISQAELARRSGVPLRQIQLFEQRQRSINRVQAETLLRLGRVLHCKMSDLME